MSSTGGPRGSRKASWRFFSKLRLHLLTTFAGPAFIQCAELKGWLNPSEKGKMNKQTAFLSLRKTPQNFCLSSTSQGSAARMLQTCIAFIYLSIYLLTADKKYFFPIYSFTMNTLELVVSQSECFNISVTKRALWPIPTGRAVQLWNDALTSRYVHLLLTEGPESQKGFTIPKSFWAQGDIAALITNSSFPLRSWLAAANAQRVRGRGDEGEPKTAIGTKLTVRF